ncbi:hypothetical protein FACS1894188_05340 [Clostridia bacterium]|nr:hypothetical protein FACS1894188_05340 [Clostridia bacterium]
MFRKKQKPVEHKPELELLQELNETLWAFHVISRRLGRKLDDYLSHEAEQTNSPKPVA